MARKADLRVQREGTVINATSSRQERELVKSLEVVCKRLVATFPGIVLMHEPQWFLRDVVRLLTTSFPDMDFHYFHETSSMRPDGGILSIVDKEKNFHPILIAEKKNQGTNDSRLAEGKPRQAKGNAIERLGKNVIGFRTALIK